MKRVFDLTMSLIVLILLSPIMIMVAVMIKLESKGPVIFKQKRVGQYGKLFFIYKFRSMVLGASSQGPHFTKNNDARVTSIGQLIRKTSLDELPQLLNVLKGDMSLVGPRPDVAAQRIDYDESEWTKRLLVLPGITGLAQARQRSLATPEERIQNDLEYVDKMSFSYDVWIISLTVKQVLIKGGN
ncbi:MAG: lipopolysaccharide/colanic/teichoic acid biosynthesis glycosyltransferase [Paraglaciecola sp.]